MTIGVGDLRHKLASYDWLGFDLDHCLARYNLGECYPLIYSAMRRYMVEHAGYAGLAEVPWAQLEPLCAKGLVIEWGTGNVLRICASGRVAAARHGRRELSSAELCEVYGDEPGGKWEHFEDLRAQKRNPKFCAFCTFFDIPAVPLYMLIVEALDAEIDAAEETERQKLRQERYDRIAPDLFEGFNHNYSADAFAKKRGWFFSALQDDIGRYVHARPWLRAWLSKLRGLGMGAGRSPRVFLATNSHADFADLVLRQTFGDDWRSALGDVLVVNCQKPKWFSAAAADSPFYCLDELVAGDTAGRVLAVGSADAVETLRGPGAEADKYVVARGCFAALADADVQPGMRICFFGDSFSSDIGPSHAAGCDSVLVLEELADDAALDDDSKACSVDAVRASGFDVEIGRCGPSEAAEAEGSTRKREPIDARFLRRSLWGSFFLCDGQEMHLWAALAQELSTGIISSVEDLDL